MITSAMVAVMVGAAFMLGGVGVVAAAGSGDCDHTQDQTQQQLKDGSCGGCQDNDYDWNHDYNWDYNYGAVTE